MYLSFKPRLVLLLVIIVGMFTALVLSGCSRARPALTPTQMAAEPPPKETLAVGDVVEVKFFNTPQLNESQTIQADGTITMQLLGKVPAQGKTPEALHQDLVKLYTPELKNPILQVLVRNKSDRKVYVSGFVNTPGAIDLVGDLTLLESVGKAGGFKIPEADTRNVLVVRQRDGKCAGCLVDLQKVLQGQEHEPFRLQPRDVVYVPPTSITKANNWVQQYISRMFPEIKGFSLFYNLAP
jgi:protein involved in polysaccharide export with SLBB domain